MPEAVQLLDRLDDPYAWALEQAALLKRGATTRNAIDAAAIGEFLEEWADDMLATVRSQIVDLMAHAHAAKVANSRNPEIVGHWRSECVEFHDRLVDAYRPSMRERIDLDALWRRARRKVEASFADYGEPKPQLPADCPFRIEQLIDPELDPDALAASLPSRNPAPP